MTAPETGHVLPPAALRVPAPYEDVERILRGYDGALRLRRSVESRDLYVLERKCSRSWPVASLLLWGDLQIQARDGYVHVCTIHPSYLARPWRILQELKATDLWAQGGAARVAQQLEDEERDAAEARRRTRSEDHRAIAAEAFPVLDRIGGIGGTERVRMNNPGLPSLSGEPATDGGDRDQQSGTPTGQQDRELHDQSGPGS